MKSREIFVITDNDLDGLASSILLGTLFAGSFVGDFDMVNVSYKYSSDPRNCTTDELIDTALSETRSRVETAIDKPVFLIADRGAPTVEMVQRIINMDGQLYIFDHHQTAVPHLDAIAKMSDRVHVVYNNKYCATKNVYDYVNANLGIENCLDTDFLVAMVDQWDTFKWKEDYTIDELGKMYDSAEGPGINLSYLDNIGDYAVRLNLLIYQVTHPSEEKQTELRRLFIEDAVIDGDWSILHAESVSRVINELDGWVTVLNMELRKAHIYKFSDDAELFISTTMLPANISPSLIVSKFLADKPGLVMMFDTQHENVKSLRSTGDIDCSIIASFFGGGGHKNASGFKNTLRYTNEELGNLVDKCRYFWKDYFNVKNIIELDSTHGTAIASVMQLTQTLDVIGRHRDATDRVICSPKLYASELALNVANMEVAKFIAPETLIKHGSSGVINKHLDLYKANEPNIIEGNLYNMIQPNEAGIMYSPLIITVCGFLLTEDGKHVANIPLVSNDLIIKLITTEWQAEGVIIDYHGVKYKYDPRFLDINSGYRNFDVHVIKRFDTKGLTDLGDFNLQIMPKSYGVSHIPYDENLFMIDTGSTLASDSSAPSSKYMEYVIDKKDLVKFK